MDDDVRRSKHSLFAQLECPSSSSRLCPVLGLGDGNGFRLRSSRHRCFVPCRLLMGGVESGTSSGLSFHLTLKRIYRLLLEWQDRFLIVTALLRMVQLLSVSGTAIFFEPCS